MASRKPIRPGIGKQTESEPGQKTQEELNALGQTIISIVHDLNNSLTGILGHARLALGQSKDESVTRHLHIIEEKTLEAAQTVLRLQKLAQSLRENTSIRNRHSGE